jgi:hypothetical protein
MAASVFALLAVRCVLIVPVNCEQIQSEKRCTPTGPPILKCGLPVPPSKTPEPRTTVSNRVQTSGYYS